MASFKVQELIIRIDSNITDSNGKTTGFKFTNSNVYFPDSEKNTKPFNTYPYFTSEILYPRNILLALEMHRRYEFFFNKSVFVDILMRSGSRDISKDEKNETYLKSLKDNEYQNIMLMIELLFPTNFPINNDIKDSYNYYILGNRGIGQNMLSAFQNPLQKKNFSYVKTGGKIYTVRKNIWLNDLLNNPTYWKLRNDYTNIKDFIENYINENRGLIATYTKNMDLKIAELDNYLAAAKEQAKAKGHADFGKIDDKREEIKLVKNKDDKDYEKNFKNLLSLQSGQYPQKHINNKDMYKNLIGKIKDLYVKINEIKENMKYIDKYNKLNINNLQNYMRAKNKNQNVSREYYNSMNSIIREYSKTNRSNPKYQTSNFELQDLFNNLYSSSAVSNIGDDHVDAEIKKFFNFMDSMYNHFIIGKSNTNINDYNSLLDVGTTISQEGNTTYREIYLLIDFFEGEINDKNKSQIFCNYVDNHLGELFEKLLIAKSFKDRTENWNAQLKRSALYSKSTGKSIQVQNNDDDKNQNKRRTDTDSSNYRDKNNSSDLTYIFSQFVNQAAENKVQEYNQLTRANNDANTLFKMNHKQPDYKDLLSIFTQNKDDTEIDEIRIGIEKLIKDSKNNADITKQRFNNKKNNPSESEDSINTLKKEIIIHEFMEIIYTNMRNYFNKKGGNRYPNRTRRLIPQKSNNKTKKLNLN